VQINPDDIQRLQPLLNLFFQQAIGLQTRELPENNPALRHQLLLMLDEFPALGRIPVIADSTAFLPGYNVRTILIVQSNSQLIEKYGVEGAKSIRKMLAARIVFPPKEYEDAEAVSRELGTCTVRQKSISRAMWGGGRSPTVTVSEQPRRLLMAQEVKELGAQRLLLFYEGLRPVLGERIYYFRDRRFARRELPPPEVPRLDLSALRPTAQPVDMPGGADMAGARSPQGTVAPHIAPHAVLPQDLHLADFSLDFGQEAIPTGQPMSEQEVQAATDAFMAHMLR
jgi:type IV secretion system protein VirD4